MAIDPNDNSYELGELRIKDTTIYANEFNVDVGTDGGDPKSVTNKADPIRYTRSKNTYEWGASSIEPEHYKSLLKIKLARTLFPIKIYNLSPNGRYVPVGALGEAKINEVNRSYGDDGITIDISGTALRFELPKETKK